MENPVNNNWFYTNHIKSPFIISKFDHCKSGFIQVMTWPCSRTVDIRSEKNGFDPVEGGMDSPPVKSIRWFISVSHLYLVYISECGCHYKPSWWYKAWLYYRELLHSLGFGTNNCSVITDISGLKYAFVKSYLHINASVQLIKLYPKNVDECLCSVYIRVCGIDLLLEKQQNDTTPMKTCSLSMKQIAERLEFSH